MRTMTKHTRQSWWLNFTGSIIGFDEGGEGDGGQGGDGGTDGGAKGQPGEGQGAGGNGGEGQGGDDPTAGLKSALEKERADRKTLDKELKALRKADEDRKAAEKSEVERLTDKSAKDETKITKLATKFRDSAIRTAILTAAGEAKFLDPSDAVTSDVISAITVEQDEDDPSEITVDEASVTAAVKALAKKKPHWLVKPTEGKTTKPKSGSSFGGSGTGNTKNDPHAELRQKYPALRGL